MIKRILSSQLDFGRGLLPRRSTDSDMTPSDDSMLFLDEGEGNISEDELINLLVSFIRIGKDSGRISLTSNFDDLNSKQKILVILFAEKLRTKHMTTQYENDEYLSPNEISKLSETGLKHLYPYIQDLERENILDYEEAHYRINPDKVSEAQQIVTDSA